MTEVTLPTAAAPATDEDDYDLETLFQPPIDIFHPLGDVVLHVVDDKNLESRFQVSTDMLAQACPFFDKLLNGDFAEGQKDDRNGSEKREVQIRENRTVVQILCCVVHHKKLEDEMKLSPSVILQYAILVDKYQCVDQLRLPNESLLQTQLQAQKTSGWRSRKDLCDLIAAAYILDMPVIFRKLTRKLANVGDSNTNLSYFDDKCSDHIPKRFFASLNAQVNTAQKTLAHHVAVLISEFSKTAKICGKDELATEFLRRLTDAGLLPAKFDSPDNSIEMLAQKLEDIEMPALLSDTEICSCPDFTFDRNVAMVPPIETARASDGTKHLRSCYRLKLENAQVVLVTQRHARLAARNVREICVGLCLDCVKKPGSQRRGACRVAHPQPWVQHARDDGDRERELDLDVFRVDRGPRGIPGDTGMGVVDRARFYMRLLQNYPRPAFWKDTW